MAPDLRAFTAPLVCDQLAVKLLVLVAPMIPAPGEAPADYWVNTSYGEEVRESYEDPIELFYRDVPPELASEAQIDGGHTPALSRPRELPAVLQAYAAQQGLGSG